MAQRQSPYAEAQCQWPDAIGQKLNACEDSGQKLDACETSPASAKDASLAKGKCTKKRKACVPVVAEEGPKDVAAPAEPVQKKIGKGASKGSGEDSSEEPTRKPKKHANAAFGW